MKESNGVWYPFVGCFLLMAGIIFCAWLLYELGHWIAAFSVGSPWAREIFFIPESSQSSSEVLTSVSGLIALGFMNILVILACGTAVVLLIYCFVAASISLGNLLRRLIG